MSTGVSPEGVEHPPAKRQRASFFTSRWRGDVPLRQLLWQDAVIYGTAINIATTLVAMLLFARDAPTALAVFIWFSPVPYNIFLFAAIWKTAGSAAEPWASAARITGLLWLLVAMAI